ncbi:MAG: lysoplasmalogenase [Chitinophagaceae bacterium]
MKKQFWIILFLLFLVGDIIGIQLQSTLIQSVFKPMLMPALIGYFLSQKGNITEGPGKWIVLALFFSLAGDVLLMFQEKKSIFFLLGLSAFLLAHIFYILFFHKIRIKEQVKSNPWFLLIVIVYYAGLMYWILPYLGDMKLPVRIYGIVISFMLMLAMHLFFIKNKNAGKWMLAGAILFVISDSVLALNKFYQSFEWAGTVIMSTYGLAQLFITEGAIKYLRNK